MHMHQTMNGQKYTLTRTKNQKNTPASNNAWLHYRLIKQISESLHAASQAHFPSFVCTLFAHQDSDHRPSALELTSLKIREPPTPAPSPSSQKKTWHMSVHMRHLPNIWNHTWESSSNGWIIRPSHWFSNPSRHTDVLFPAPLVLCT